MAAGFSSLPDEITEQIFVKTSCTKSIVTCTSVCKSWYALIKSPRFINFHLSNPNHNNKEYFLCSNNYQPYHSIKYNDSGYFETYYDLEFPHERSMKIIGSINGLICCNAAGGDIYIWNPAIRKSKILPKSEFSKEESSYGFWFDANTNDYKVAKINYKIRCNVEVYSLSTNSWELIATGGPNLGTYDKNLIIHVINGTLHWLISRGAWEIISFDTNKRIFKKTVIIWQDDQLMESSFDFVVTESHGRPRFVLQRQYWQPWQSWDSDHFCCVRVYDEDFNELYMIDFKKKEKLCSLIGVRNNHSHEVLFLDENWRGTNEVIDFGDRRGPKLVVCSVEDFSDIEALKLKDFSTTYDCFRTIRRIQPFAESLVLLND